MKEVKIPRGVVITILIIFLLLSLYNLTKAITYNKTSGEVVRKGWEATLWGDTGSVSPYFMVTFQNNSRTGSVDVGFFDWFLNSPGDRITLAYKEKKVPTGFMGSTISQYRLVPLLPLTLILPLLLYSLMLWVTIKYKEYSDWVLVTLVILFLIETFVGLSYIFK